MTPEQQAKAEIAKSLMSRAQDIDSLWCDLYEQGLVRIEAGMWTRDGLVIGVKRDTASVFHHDTHQTWTWSLENLIPDFNAATTKGLLLEQARVLWDDPIFAVVCLYHPQDVQQWRCWSERNGWDSKFNITLNNADIHFPTEAAAILTGIAASALTEAEYEAMKDSFKALDNQENG
jgi:hypothetical protein